MDMAITGCSLILPGFDAGLGVRQGLQASRPSPKRIDAFDTEMLGMREAGFVAGDALRDFPVKLRNQCDRSTLLGMQCLSDVYAGGPKGVVPPDRLGVFCTTTLGGVEFSESQLFAQAFVGPHRVSAYQAIAWFYAAAQGQWTISERITGYAKSFVGDRVGAIEAVIAAGMALEAGHCDVALCASYEAPISPFSLALLESGGRTAGTREDYLSEGAAALCLEPLDRAVERGAAIFGIVLGADTRAVRDDPEAALRLCLSSTIDQANARGVSLGAALFQRGRNDIEDGMHDAFAVIEGADEIAVQSGLGKFGDLLSVGCYVDLISACLRVDDECAPSPLGHNSGDGFLLVAADEAAVGCLAIARVAEDRLPC